MSIETAIYVTAKVTGAVKPRTGTNEDTARKPFRTVVAIGGAVVRSIVIVPIRASGFGSAIVAVLSLYFRCGDCEANSGNCSSESKTFDAFHKKSS